MYDIVSVVFVLGFFALCLAYVHACDKILGPDDQVAAEAMTTAPTEPVGPTDEAVAA